MIPVRIVSVGVAHPELRVSQEDAARAIGMAAGDERRVAAIARGTAIRERAVALPPDELLRLGAAGARNDVYREVAPRIAVEAARRALGEAPGHAVRCVVTSSCTGYMAPSWGTRVVGACGVPHDAMRLPITEAGCAGGVVAMARAADYLRVSGGGYGLAAASELCSLAFHAGGDDGNITSTLIFGDGAGAALLHAGAGDGLEIVDTMSVLVPESEHALGFALTDQGFYPLLSRELPALLPEPTRLAVQSLLGRNALAAEDVGGWLLHPGGARILVELERALGVCREQTRWSWASMAEYGNTSSAAIFDVVRRFMEDDAPAEWAVAAAFGPGVAIELLLLRRRGGPARLDVS